MSSQVPKGFYTGTAATAKSLADIIATTVPTDATFCYVQCETQNCKWRDDGNNPTASTGMLLTAGDVLILTRGQFAAFRIIEVAASTKVNVTFYK